MKHSCNKILLYIIFFAMIFFGYKALASFIAPQEYLNFNSSPKDVYLNDNGLFYTLNSPSETIDDFLRENNIQLASHDYLIPDKNERLYPGTRIEIQRAIKIKIEVDGKNIENYTLSKDIASVLAENNVSLNHLDKVSPNLTALPQENVPIIVTRINVEEKNIPEEIDFKTIYNSDDSLGWREEKVTQEGIKGVREVTYRLTYKNGQEISRVPLQKNIAKEPTPEIVTKGTYMKLGKKDNGIATWYSYKGGMYAASTALAKGSYAKVTNTANGKSIVVQINDYGPFGKGRIIDLDKAAFAKIASLGAGVTQVKVEQVLN